jgi:hypothetical protein
MTIAQKRLAERLFKTVKKKYPEVQLLSMQKSPEDASDIWLNITSPDDEDREIALREFSADKSTDILLKHGYSIIIMPTRAVVNEK